MSRLHFTLARSSPAGTRARAGTFRTLHNEVLTPLFMPVGTQATVKAQLPQTLLEAGSQILLANTYHLLLRPGPEVFQRLGGIHGFTNWPLSVLTDSGGFQIFSLPHSRSMAEEGARFQSYTDGRTILLSPELSIATQRAIGSDIMMALDQCVPSTADAATSRAALQLTHRWAARSLAARGDSPQAMFAIIQGALFPDQRRESALTLAEMPFDGLAIGGLAVGETKAEREDLCEYTAGLMPADRPRYLMGVGTPLDILEAVHRGIDMFDCIIPTQVAQRGGVFTSRGYLQMRRGIYKFSSEPLDPICPCPTCARHSRAYLHHLTKTRETLGWQLLGQHNIYFYHQLMREIRASILAGTFAEFHRTRRELLHEDDLDNPTLQPKPRNTRPPRLGDYEIHAAPAGFHSIRQVSSGEIMHASMEPMEEARLLYVKQACLAERLCALPRDDDSDGAPATPEPPLVIWDVGLGAAANAMAAIRCYEQTASMHRVRPLRILSFENDLDSLRLAFHHRRLFPYLRHAGPDAILQSGQWQSRAQPGLSWQLIPGDFQDCIHHAPAPSDLIFYDLFSGNSAPEGWTPSLFRALFLACAGRPVWLFSYTAATAVRAALLAAGFSVARGISISDRAETTAACTPAALADPLAARLPLLDATWLTRWRRSSSQFPLNLLPALQADFAASVENHPQFQTAPVVFP